MSGKREHESSTVAAAAAAAGSAPSFTPTPFVHELPAWHSTAMARASRPLLGVRAATGRLSRGSFMPPMSQAAVPGEGSGYCGWCVSAPSHCCPASRPPALLAVVVDVEERLRLEAVELRRASASAAL